MSEVIKKVEFLKGMAEGMNLKADTAEHKLMLKMLEVMEEMAEVLEEVSDHQDELDCYVDELDSDLGELEEEVYGLPPEDRCECGHHHHHPADEEDWEEDEDEDCDCGEDDEEAGEDFLEYECPHCGASVYYDQNYFDLEEEHLCPDCGRELFPTAPDEE